MPSPHLYHNVCLLTFESTIVILKNTVGAFFAGLPFGLVVKKSSWTTALYAVEAVGAIYILCMFYLYIKHYNSYMTITTKKQK